MISAVAVETTSQVSSCKIWLESVVFWKVGVLGSNSISRSCRAIPYVAFTMLIFDAFRDKCRGVHPTRADSIVSREPKARIAVSKKVRAL